MAVIVVVGIFYLYTTRQQIFTDKADIEAPSIVIASSAGGILQKMLVENGQQVAAGTPVAQVADQVLRSDDAGLVIDAQSIEGKTVNAGEPVVTLIHPEDLRVVAHIDEDKGLSGIRVGQLVNFTVDTFGSKKYTGIVEEISATSRQSGVVFNISDQREVKQFDVKIKFDVKKFPELKNGMSAKVTIFKK
jgi:multidrug resistance efflux pump